MKVTSQHPIHKHVFTVLYRNTRFDVNIKHDLVSLIGCGKMGSFSTRIKCDVTSNKFLTFVKKHVDTLKISL